MNSSHSLKPLFNILGFSNSLCQQIVSFVKVVGGCITNNENTGNTIIAKPINKLPKTNNISLTNFIALKNLRRNREIHDSADQMGKSQSRVPVYMNSSWRWHLLHRPSFDCKTEVLNHVLDRPNKLRDHFTPHRHN